MFSDVLNALKFLSSAVTGRRQLKDQDRQKFAGICDNISDVLQRFIDASQDRRQSIHLCAELSEYVRPIRDLASGKLASDEINRLATVLDNVCEAWSRERGAADAGLHSDERYLDQIVEAAGSFRGLANRLRAI
jgi:hypothetical protein